MHPLLDEGFLILSFASTLALFSLSLHVHRLPLLLAVTLLNERIASSYRRERIWKE